MVDGVRVGKDALKSRFGLSERLAVRVGALLGRGLEMTAAVLEEIGRSRELESLVLSADLLAKAESLDTAGLRALGPAASVLVVVPRDGTRVVALEEEVQAEKAWKSSTPATLPALAVPAALAREPSSAAELRFTADDLAQLRMTLLTGVDPRAKIEALRKLVYAPIDAGERGALTLRALGDPDAQVRQEAAAALERLGLGADHAEALRTVAAGSARQKAVALQKLASMAGRGTAAERSVTLATLASALEHERDATVLRGVIETLAGYAAALTPDAVGQVARMLVKAMAEQHDALEPAARSLLEAVARGGADVGATIWREVEGVSDRRLKVFFFEVLCAMPLSPELARELCRRAASELMTAPLDDLSVRRLADAMARMGDVALKALLAALPEAREDNRAALVALVDGLAAGDGVSRELRNETGERFLDLLRGGSRIVRTAILEARCCRHPQLDGAIKRKLAADYLASLHAVRAPRFHEMTVAALRRMGTEIVEPLKHCLAKSAYPVERGAAAAVLADIAAETAERGVVEEIIELLRREETAERITVGQAVRAVGRAASSRAAPSALVMKIYEDYWARLSKVSYAFDVLAALWRIASGPSCAAGASTQLVLKLLDLLESPMPDPTVSETKTDEGTHLLIGAQTVVYTDYIPELIAGVRAVAVSGRLRDAVRKSIVERLCARYVAVTEYREIWAPGNVVDLAEALGDIACVADAPLRDRVLIMETMLANLRNLTMVRVLGRVCRRPEEDSKMHAALAGKFVRRGLEMLGKPEYQEPEDQRLIIESIGRVAVNRLIGESKKESEDLRSRVIELLIEHLEDAREARALLRDVAASENVSKSLRKRAAEVAER